MLAISLFWINSVSYENPGIRLELFLKELAKQSGQSFHCPQYLNNEVLVASFRDQTVDVIKAQLAKVINGTWEERTDGWWLVQTSDQKKAEERLVYSRRNQILQNQLEGLKAIAPKAEWGTKDAEKYWLDMQTSRKRTGEGVWNSAQRKAFRLKSPESRFMSTVASRLKPEMLASDPTKPDIRRYTVRGLPNQVELPIDISDILHQYNNETQLLRTISGETPSFGTSASHVEIQYDTSEVPFVVVTFYDRKWQYVSSALPSAFLPTTYVAASEVFPLSVETQEVLNLAKQLPIYNGESVEDFKRTPVHQAVVDTLGKAMTRDPLGVRQGRCWIDFAKSAEKPMLVNLEDDPDVWRPKNYVPAIEQKGLTVGMKRQDADGWILGSPLNPQHNRTWRIDRSLVERFATLSSLKAPSINVQLQKMDIICYANLFTNGIPNSQFIEDMFTDYKWSIAALGTLTPDQLSACLRGATIPVSSLSERAQFYISMMASEGYLNVLSSFSQTENDSMCPRYCLPNGIGGMHLGASRTSEMLFSFTEEVVGIVNEGDGLDLDSFAQTMKKASQQYSSLLEKKFIISTIQRFVSAVHLGDKKFTEELDLDRSDSPEYTWKTLPDPIKKRVLEAMKDAGK